ncbi:hypothetical protein ACFL1I_08205 [Candidatus Omnitrophota bacterium]
MSALLKIILLVVGCIICAWLIMVIFMKTRMKNGHFVTKLKCPKCSFEGTVTYGKQDFKVLGKDEEGYLYFGCPKCKSHLKYNSLTERITLAK